MAKKSVSLSRYDESTLVRALGDAEGGLSGAAFFELVRRGEKRGWEAYNFLTLDPALAALFVSPKDPFDGVGVLAGTDPFARVRRAWPDAVETGSSTGRRTLAIDFRHRRLNVIRLMPEGTVDENGPVREGLGEVEFRVTNVDAAVQRLSGPGVDAGRRVVLLPRDPDESGRFLLVHVPSLRGARTVLVRLVS